MKPTPNQPPKTYQQINLHNRLIYPLQLNTVKEAAPTNQPTRNKQGSANN
jgi:hypothetical protein